MTYFNFLFDYFYHNIINTFLKRQKNQSFLIDLIINIALVRRFLQLEQVSRIELPSQPWQGRILTAVLHLHTNNIITHFFKKGIPKFKKVGGASRI